MSDALKHLPEEGRHMVQAAQFAAPDALAAAWTVYQDLMAASDGAVPAKSSIRMSDFRTYIPRLLMSERISDSDIRIRISGNDLDELFGLPLSGQSALDLSPEPQRPRIARVYRWLCETPMALHLKEEIRCESGRVIPLESLLLPLANKEGVVCFVMALYAILDTRFDAGPCENEPISHVRLIRSTYLDLGIGDGLPADLSRDERPKVCE